MRQLKTFLLILSFVFTTHSIAQTVYVTKTGEKYHKKGCRFLKYSKKDIQIEKALELGYTPCKVCKPIIKQQKSKSNNSSGVTSYDAEKAPQPREATQCTGKTKSGKRCKRRTKNANGRCYQHVP